MAINPVTGNLFPGLAEGPIQADATVVNATIDATFAFIGQVVEINPNPTGILPPVSVANVQGNPTYGVEVSGVRKGVYGTPQFFVPLSGDEPTLIAFDGEGVRVCTQGVCLASVVTRTGDDIKIGDPLTADLFFSIPDNFETRGMLSKAQSGDFVIARALQPIPTGTPEVPQVRFAAVNVQREGELP